MYDDSRELIEFQRLALSDRLERLLRKTADRCARVWVDPNALDTVLAKWLARIQHGRVLYAVDTFGLQTSANVHNGSIDTSKRGQDLSCRPYLQDLEPDTGFCLSQAYISDLSRRPCITAVQAVYRDGGIVGYVAADFELRDLPLMRLTYHQNTRRRRLQGERAVRSSRDGQHRWPSAIDGRVDDVVAIVNELMTERGVFHGKIHFSSDRVTLWLMDDPYRYRLHTAAEITDPAICLAYPRRAWPNSAVTTRRQVTKALARLKALRFAHPLWYLHAGSINVMNGMVGLTFSSGSSYYLGTEEFLASDAGHWVQLLEHEARADAGATAMTSAAG